VANDEVHARGSAHHWSRVHARCQVLARGNGASAPPRALGLSALPEARTRLTDLDRLASSYDPSVHLLRRW